MSQVTANVSQYDLTNITDAKQFQQFGSQVISSIQTFLNGNQGLQNLQLNSFSVNFPVANANVSVKHNLNKSPVNYLVAGQNIAGSIFYGTGGDKNTLNIQSSASGMQATVLIF